MPTIHDIGNNDAISRLKYERNPAISEERRRTAYEFIEKVGREMARRNAETNAAIEDESADKVPLWVAHKFSYCLGKRRGNRHVRISENDGQG